MPTGWPPTVTVNSCEAGSRNWPDASTKFQVVTGAGAGGLVVIKSSSSKSGDRMRN